MNKNAIYIFTCNRPSKLERLLYEMCFIQKSKHNIYIVDDSSKKESIEKNRMMANKYDSAKYLGINQYRNFYRIEDVPHNRQLLGDETWNLGIARNFALEYSNFIGHKKILFVDDDITEIDENKVNEGFSVLNEDSFVSCNLKGVVDDSIVGHIAKQVGIIEDEKKMLSGGFLFLSPSSISNRFYNIYNEDWILQLLENQKKQIILPYNVLHNIDKDIIFSLEQALFQELGELVVEGLLENENALLMNYNFWDEVLINRIKFIEEIKEATVNLDNQHGYEICSGLLKWLKQLEGHSVLKSIEQIKNMQYEYKI